MVLPASATRPRGPLRGQRGAWDPSGASFPSSEGSAPGGHSGLSDLPIWPSCLRSSLPQRAHRRCRRGLCQPTSVGPSGPARSVLIWRPRIWGLCVRGCGRSPHLPRDSGPMASLGWTPSTPTLGVAPTAAQPSHSVASCSQGSLPFRRRLTVQPWKGYSVCRVREAALFPPNGGSLIRALPQLPRSSKGVPSVRIAVRSGARRSHGDK